MCVCVCLKGSGRAGEEGWSGGRGTPWNTFTLSGYNFHTRKERKADTAATCTLPLITLLTSPLDPAANGPLPGKQEVAAGQPGNADGFQMDPVDAFRSFK